MISLLRKFFGSEDAAERDAGRIYQSAMAQSRNPVFYGDGAVPDTQEGRLELLNIHLSAVFAVLPKFGETGRRLSQALFDVMRDDLDVALREEGYTDSGVKRRIKPMIKRFYAGLKAYQSAYGDIESLRDAIGIDLDQLDNEFQTDLTEYASALHSRLDALPLGDIASANFTYPRFRA